MESEVKMKYYKKISTGNIAVFSDFQTTPPEGYEEATQAEIDEYLLEQAKKDKVIELKSVLHDFMITGYEYTGNIVCAAWDSQTTYDLYELVLGSDSKNYKSLIADNQGNDPISSPEEWEEFYPVFKFDNAGILNVRIKDGLDPGAPDRYKFYDKGCTNGFRNQINFGDSTNWNNFAKDIEEEEDRVMKKYNDYRSQIALCTTIQQVDDITINFSS